MWDVSLIFALYEAFLVWIVIGYGSFCGFQTESVLGLL